MAMAAAYLHVSGSPAAVSYRAEIVGADWEEAKRNGCFMPHDTREGAIMNKVIAILSFVVVGYATSDVSWADRHASLSTDRYCGQRTCRNARNSRPIIGSAWLIPIYIPCPAANRIILCLPEASLPRTVSH